MKWIIVLLFIALVLLIYSYIETLRLTVTHYTIYNKLVPESLNNKCYVLLSDLHCIEFGRNNYRLMQLIKSSNPNCIVIAGDVINGHSESEFEYAVRLLVELKKLNIPVYYALGNHESKFLLTSKRLYRRYISEIKKYATVLNNQRILSSTGVELIGLVLDLDTFHAPKKELKENLVIEDYIGSADQSKYSILIAHDPTHAQKYSDWGADLVLCGHYHGGIFRLPFIGGLISPRYRFFPRFEKGYYKINKTEFIVSGGLGWHGIPFRFLNLPEIVLIEFSSCPEV